jgi:hypothetical protein
MRAWRITSAAATAVLGVTGIGLVWAFGGDDRTMELTAVGGTGSGYGFQVEAKPVTELYPGALTKLTVSFRNPYDVDLRVTGMRGQVLATSRRGCLPTATNLAIRSYSGVMPLTVPADGRKAGGHLPLYMPNSVADACQGATFTIRLRGEATKVKR